MRSIAGEELAMYKDTYELSWERAGVELTDSLPLILIMGLGADHSGWFGHLNSLKQHFNCVMPDNRGTGRSPKPVGPYSIEEMAYDTLRLMDKLDIACADVNGCSMGSAIALQMAIIAPSRIRNVVLTAPFAKLDDYGRRMLRLYAKTREHLDYYSYLEFKMWATYSRDYHLLRGDKMHDDILVTSVQAEQQAPHLYKAQIQACLDFDITERLGDIESRVLICAGKDDHLSPPSHARWMHDQLPNSTLLAFNGGHNFHYENSNLYTDAVIKFLKGGQT